MTSATTRAEGGAARQRRIVVWLLTLVYALNFLDRQIMSVLLPAIQAEFHVGDAMAGLLHGAAFSLFYVTLAIPIARYADRGPRVRIIAVATALWSVATAVCGTARTFGQLFLARVAVGVGEAGCSPAAYSLLAAYFPPGKRAGPMSLYAVGIPVGGALGFIGGGFLGQAYGWRSAFLICGLPGVLVALLVALVIREPARSTPVESARTSLVSVAIELRRRPFIWHATAGTALLAAAGFAAGTWVPSFLIRTHHLSGALTGAALAILTLSAIPAGILAGRTVDRWSIRDPRYYVWLPAFAMLAAVPFSLAGLAIPAGTSTIFGHAVPNVLFVVLLFIAPTAASAVYAGPVLAAIHTIVPDRARATTTAMFLFATNLIGMGAGPALMGALSDSLRAAAGHDSLRWALATTAAINTWAAFHFWRASRHLEADLKKSWAD